MIRPVIEFRDPSGRSCLVFLRKISLGTEFCRPLDRFLTAGLVVVAFHGKIVTPIVLRCREISVRGGNDEVVLRAADRQGVEIGLVMALEADPGGLVLELEGARLGVGPVGEGELQGEVRLRLRQAEEGEGRGLGLAEGDAAAVRDRDFHVILCSGERRPGREVRGEQGKGIILTVYVVQAVVDAAAVAESLYGARNKAGVLRIRGSIRIHIGPAVGLELAKSHFVFSPQPGSGNGNQIPGAVSGIFIHGRRGQPELCQFVAGAFLRYGIVGMAQQGEAHGRDQRLEVQRHFRRSSEALAVSGHGNLAHVGLVFQHAPLVICGNRLHAQHAAGDGGDIVARVTGNSFADGEGESR